MPTEKEGLQQAHPFRYPTYINEGPHYSERSFFIREDTPTLRLDDNEWLIFRAGKNCITPYSSETRRQIPGKDISTQPFSGEMVDLFSTDYEAEVLRGPDGKVLFWTLKIYPYVDIDESVFPSDLSPEEVKSVKNNALQYIPECYVSSTEGVKLSLNGETLFSLPPERKITVPVAYDQVKEHQRQQLSLGKDDTSSFWRTVRKIRLPTPREKIITNLFMGVHLGSPDFASISRDITKHFESPTENSGVRNEVSPVFAIRSGFSEAF